MRAPVLLFAIASLAMLQAGCGANDPDASGQQDLTVTRPPLSLALGVDALAAGESLTAVVTLGTPAPAEGAVILLSSTDAKALAMPPAITIAAEAYTASFVVSSRYVGKRKSVTIRATYQDALAESVLFIPSDPHAVCNLHICP